jgi:hypothetical protein
MCKTKFGRDLLRGITIVVELLTIIQLLQERVIYHVPIYQLL